MEYFSPAVQLGLTATPRRDFNADTYNYFGKPVYEYSLKQGINDGFLTPFRHIVIKSTLDDYVYEPSDTIEDGELDEVEKLVKELEQIKTDSKEWNDIFIDIMEDLNCLKESEDEGKILEAKT